MVLQSNIAAHRAHRSSSHIPIVRATAVASVLAFALLIALAGGAGCADDHIFEMGSDGGALTDAGASDAGAGPTSDTTGDGAPPGHDGGSDISDDAAAGDARDDDAAADTAQNDDAISADGGPSPDDALTPADGAADAVPDTEADAVSPPDTTPDGARDSATDAPSDTRADGGGVERRLAVSVEDTVAMAPWDHVERLWLDHDALAPETFIAKTRQRDDAIVAAFDGDAEPPPGRFLLHAAPGWDDGAGVPVLLVHGAGSHANQSWIDPDPLGADPGLATSLADAGRRVFAVTFPARYGDNLNQGLALAAALQRVREKTGAARLDVVAHSKGGVALLVYLADLLASRGVPYAGEVRRAALLGVPLGGMDFSFRHPAFNYSSHVWGLELPSSWDQVLLYGVWQDRYDESIYGGAYDGLLQTLARWDDVHPLSMIEQDWYTTYEGGFGFVSHSLGIDAAIDLGGDLVARLRAASLPSALSVSLLVGTHAFVGAVPWETTGPSDGLVFVASAGDSDWVAAAGAAVGDVRELDANHWELLHAAEARGWVEAVLTAE